MEHVVSHNYRKVANSNWISLPTSISLNANSRNAYRIATLGIKYLRITWEIFVCVCISKSPLNLPCSETSRLELSVCYPSSFVILYTLHFYNQKIVSQALKFSCSTLYKIQFADIFLQTSLIV